MSEHVRPVRISQAAMQVQRRADGSVVVTSRAALGAYPARFTDYVRHWAGVAPARPMLAERGADGAWRYLAYGQAWTNMQAVAQGLLDRGLTARPVLILSGNSIAHATMTLGAMLAGVPAVPVSTAYSLASRSFEKLRAIAALAGPGLVFSDDAVRFAPAVASLGLPVPVVGVQAIAGVMPFADLLATLPGADLAQVTDGVGSDTVAKIMFTSGSTGTPKAVATTHRMLCSNQQMVAQTFQFLTEAPPVLVDWLPWSHSFGGNHNLGIVIANGGTLYIDEGRPVPGGFEPTLRNLRDVAPTLHLNVPRAYEELVPHLRDDRTLRENFFRDARMLFYSGASVQPWVLEALDRLAVATIGTRVQWMTSLGCTETAPAALTCPPALVSAGVVGLPLPGVELKLAPVGEKLEARIRGPNVMRGYWHDPAASARAFDDEGFYCMGDALLPIAPDRYDLALRFDGRVVEDFKLSSGTWVFVGALRLRLLAALAPHVRDVVIAGHDRDYIALLAIPQRPELARDPAARADIAAALCKLGHGAGSASRPLRLGFLTATLSVDAGELTDKGSISQRTILRRHADLVERLFAEPAPDDVICVRDRLLATPPGERATAWDDRAMT